MKLITSWLKINRALGATVATTVIFCALVVLGRAPSKTTVPPSKVKSVGQAPKEATACSASAIFTGDFTQQAGPSEQVKQRWLDFAQSLVPGDYDTVTIKGTFDSTGRTLQDAVIVPQ